jgi:hypothetical protein
MSWTRRGWGIRAVLNGASIPRGKGVRVVDPTVINYAFKRGRARIKKYGAPGWDKAPLVKFPEAATEYTILNCGRAI